MLRPLLGALALGLALATPSLAAPVITLDPVYSRWLGIKPPELQYTQIINGQTSTITWGTPRRQPLPSGYVFQGAATTDIQLGVDFNVGTFTHLNRIIAVGTSITSALLALDMSLTIDGTKYTFDPDLTFEFLHDETRNQDAICFNGRPNGQGVNVNGCADRVRIADNEGRSDSIVVNGIAYKLQITGFLVGGSLFDEFWTVEQRDNSAIIRGRIVAEPVTPPPPPPPSPVPVPGAVWLLGGALAGLGALRRRA